MHFRGTTGIRLLCSSIVFSIILFSAAGLWAQEVYLCVWRNPERTMTRIFPEAGDYKTVTVDISREQREKIEAAAGFALLPGQRESFQYFEMLDSKGGRIGTVIAASQKGEYGAIEFVVGVDTSNIISGLYIQRSREKDRRFKERDFLDLFAGKKIAPVSAVKEAYKGEKTVGTSAVINGLVKEFVAYDLLVSGAGQ